MARVRVPAFALVLAALAPGCASREPAPARAPPVASPSPIGLPPPPPPPLRTPVPVLFASEAVSVSFPSFVASLRREAESGRDADLSGHADLLAAIEQEGLSGTEETSVVHVRGLESAERARLGRGTSWATVLTYVERGASADALRRAHMDYDRIGEWTGRPVARVLSREGGALLVEADGVRRIATLELGARWHFRARAVDRGEGRLVITALSPWDGAAHALATHGLVIAFPEPGGVRVVEAASLSLDLEVPGILRGPATAMAEKEMKARIAGIRAHWREYAR